MKEVYTLTKSIAFFKQTLAFHCEEHSHFYWTIKPASYGAGYLDMEFSTHDIHASYAQGVKIPKAYISIRYSCPDGTVFTAKTQREYVFELREKCVGKLIVTADDDDWSLLQPLWLELRATLMRWEVIPKRRFDDLAPHLLKVAHSLADGLDDAEIAKKLNLSKKTIPSYRQDIQNRWSMETQDIKLMQERARELGYGGENTS